MKIVSVYISVMVILLVIGGCTSPVAESSYRVGYDFSQVDKVAIVAVEGAVKNESTKNQIAQFFAMELLKKGYAPIGRDRVKATLAEQQLSVDPNTTQGATRAGQILKVPAVLLVSIPYFGEQISMTAVMLDAQDGSYLWIGSDSGITGSGGSEGSGALATILGTDIEADFATAGEAEQALSSIMPEPSAPAGQALTPREASNVQAVIERLCRTLPPRTSKKKAEHWPF